MTKMQLRVGMALVVMRAMALGSPRVLAAVPDAFAGVESTTAPGSVEDKDVLIDQTDKGEVCPDDKNLP
jgi:hypothetical protein